MSGEFRFPVRMSQALGYDEPEGTKKPQEDIVADLDLRDIDTETFLSSVSQSNISTGSWVTYVPTITGTGWAQGNGTLVGERLYNGEQTVFVVKLTFGSTTTAGAGNLAFALPATPHMTLVPLNTYILDTSASQRYGGGGELQSTLAYPMLTGAAGAMSFVVAGAPVTFSTGDIIAMVGTYHKA